MGEINKYTTQEVLNKVYTDDSDNTISLQAQTTKETLNAVLNSGENSLNVSLAGSNTITGDVTISGDLSVTGSSSITVNEVIQGTSTIDVNSTEALLVRKDGDSGDILTIDTTNSLMKLGKNGGTPAGLNIYGATNGNPLLIYEDTDNSLVLNFYLDSSDNSGLALYANAASQKVNLGTTASSPTYFTGGSVGIGTATPQSFDSEANNLVVGDGSGDNGITIFTGSSAGDYGSIFFGDGTGTPKQGQIRYEQNNEVMSFYTNTTERMRIDLNGNIGFGGLTPTSYYTDYDNLVLGATSGSTGMTIVSGGSNNGTVAFADGTSSNARYRGEVGFSHNNEFLFLNTAGSYRMVISAEASYMGMVGIGVTDPNSMLMVGSATGGDVSVASTDTTLEIGDTLGSFMFKGKDDGGDHSYGIGAKIVAKCTEDWNENTSEGTKLEFYTTANGANTNGNPVMVIGQDGNVGIGDTSPDNKLSIYGGDKQIRMGTSDANHVVIGRNSSTGNFEMARTCTNAAEEVFFRAAEHEAGALTFFTSEVARFIIDANSRISLGNNDSSGATSNTIFGRLAGNAIDNGAIDNVLIGNEAGNDITTGDYNIALGANALEKETVGRGSIAIGAVALGLQNTASEGSANNIGIGLNAGVYNVTGTNNTLIGTNVAGGAGSANSHSYNTAVGSSALLAVTTGGSNVSVGALCLEALTTGAENTAIGAGAMREATTGYDNVAIGREAMGLGITTGFDNVAVGKGSGYDLTSGQFNTLIGRASGAELTTGWNSVMIGYATGDATVDSHKHTLVGAGACGNGDLTTDGAVAVGYTALADLTVGTCVGVGFEAGKANAGGGNNTFLGYKSGHTGTVDVVGGHSNTFVGAETRGSNASAINQTVIGKGAHGQGNNTVTLGNVDVTAVYMAQDSGATIYASNGVFVDDTSFITVRDSSAYSAGTGGGISFQGLDSAENLKQFGTIQGYSIGNNNGGVAIYTRDGGSNNLAVVIDNNRAVKPGADSAYDLGTSSLTWRTLYAENIKFPATQVASADANTLDDYEEGVFEVAVTGGTSGSWSTSSSGGYLSYVKIGKLCHVSGYIEVDTDNSASGIVKITLPFTSAVGLTEASDLQWGSASVADGGSTLNAVTSGAYIPENQAHFHLYYVADAGAYTYYSDSNLDDTWIARVGFTYRTNN